MEDPRIVRTRTTVLDAAADLLVEGGPGAVTMDAIVARSGVAKSTIYRHWPSRDDVLVDVFAACAPELGTPDESLPFADALRTIVSSIVAFLHDPRWARMVPALLMLKTHEDGVADIEQRMEKRQNEIVAEVLRRGIEEGTIRADVDTEEATAQIVGPLLFAHLTGIVELDEPFADRVVDAFIRAHTP
jgi:AcrR family transcriptional regulator